MHTLRDHPLAFVLSKPQEVTGPLETVHNIQAGVSHAHLLPVHPSRLRRHALALPAGLLHTDQYQRLVE